MNASESAPTAGCALYHAIWQKVKDNFFDGNRLTDWDSYEHRYDALIVDDETALKFAREALATLNDTYTCLLPIDTPVVSNDPDEPVEKKEDEPENILVHLGPTSNIGYVRIIHFDDPNLVAELEEKLKPLHGCAGLILDLRANGGGLMDQAAKACQFFIHQGRITTFESRTEGGIKKRHTWVTLKQFGYTDEMPDGTSVDTPMQRLGYPMAGKPVVVMLGAKTASAAELLAAAVLTNNYQGRCLSVGRETAGKGTGQQFFDILGKVKLRVSYCRFLAPTGHWFGDCGQTEANGIDPDIVVKDDTGVNGLSVATEELKKMIAALQEGDAVES